MFEMIGAFLQGLFGLVGSQMQISAQEEARSEEFAFTESQSEKAYSRSTPSYQISELVRSGMTEQQARQTIAGSYSSASYNPAGLPSVSVPDYSALMQSFAPLAQSFSALSKDMVESENGGMIGQMLTSEIQDEITSHLNEISLEGSSSISGFLSWCNEQPEGSWCRSEDFQRSWNRSMRSITGRKAIQNYFKTNQSLEIGAKAVRRAHIDNTGQLLSNNLKRLDYQSESIKLELDKLNLVASEQTIPALTTLQLQQFANDLSEAVLKSELWLDSSYRRDYLAQILTDKRNQYLIAKIAEARLNPSLSFLQDKDNAYMMSIYELFNSVGMTNTDIGSAAAIAQASGIDLIGALRDLVPSVDSVAENVGEAVKNVVDAVSNTTEDAKLSLGVFFDGLKEDFTGEGRRLGSRFMSYYYDMLARHAEFTRKRKNLQSDVINALGHTRPFDTPLTHDAYDAEYRPVIDEYQLKSEHYKRKSRRN